MPVCHPGREFPPYHQFFISEGSLKVERGIDLCFYLKSLLSPGSRIQDSGFRIQLMSNSWGLGWIQVTHVIQELIGVEILRTESLFLNQTASALCCLLIQSLLGIPVFSADFPVFLGRPVPPGSDIHKSQFLQ